MSEKQYFIFEPGDVARLASFNIDRGIGENKFVTAILDVTAQAGTTPTLDISFEIWDETSAKWHPLATPVAFTQVTTVLGQETIDFECRATRVRAVVAIGGTTPSYTFTLALHTSR